MLHDPDFIPNRSNKILQSWIGKGLISFSRFLTENTINTYEAMASMYDLEPKHFFKYLRIRSYIKKNSEEEKNGNELLQYLVKNRNQSRMKLSRIYIVRRKSLKENFETTQSKH